MADTRRALAEKIVGPFADPRYGPMTRGTQAGFLPGVGYRGDGTEVRGRGPGESRERMTPLSHPGEFATDMLSAPAKAVTNMAVGLGSSIADAAMLPGDVVTGKVDPRSEEGMRRAVDFGGTVMTGGLGLGIMGGQPRNALGIFGGRMAKTADQAALARAEDMAAKGAPREQIWSETGWFKGVDGKWRFEIDDSVARYNPSPLIRSTSERTGKSAGDVIDGGVAAPLYRVMDHQPLYDAYPMSSTPWAAVPRRAGAEWRGERGGAVLPTKAFTDRDYGRSTTLHELQHGIQEREGFARGGNARMFSPEELATERARIMSVKDDGGWGSVTTAAGDKPDRDIGHSLYRRLAGETEARAVQKRLDLTPDQRRARPPWLDYDVPEAQQIVRTGSGGPQMSAPAQPKGITAYHGSPHDFDRFDISKIGTGEGALAYGHGLYFAENEGVAAAYKKQLSQQHFYKQQLAAAKYALRDAEEAAGKTMLGRQKTNDVIEQLRARIAEYEAKSADDGLVGRMYEVRINADPEQFLDWDKPLSQQSESVRRAIGSADVASRAGDDPMSAAQYNKAIERLMAEGMADPYGKEILQRVGEKKLSELGIPGIKYLDQGSRASGEGSRNYVVIDDKIVDILKKYGLAGLFAGGAAANAPAPADASPRRPLAERIVSGGRN